MSCKAMLKIANKILENVGENVGENRRGRDVVAQDKNGPRLVLSSFISYIVQYFYLSF